MQPAGVRNWKCFTTLFGDQSIKTSNLTRNGSIEDVPGEDISLLDNIPVEQKRTTKRYCRNGAVSSIIQTHFRQESIAEKNCMEDQEAEILSMEAVMIPTKVSISQSNNLYVWK